MEEAEGAMQYAVRGSYKPKTLPQQSDVAFGDNRLSFRVHPINHKHITPNRLLRSISTTIPTLRNIPRLEDHLAPAVVDAK